MAWGRNKDVEIFEDVNTIHPLYDIGNYSGNSESNLGRTLAFLFGTGVPVALLLYYGVGHLPFGIIITVSILWAIRMAMITYGRESERKVAHRKRIWNLYETPEEYDNLMYIHKDGLIEMDDRHVGMILYVINGTSTNELSMAKQLTNLIRAMFVKFDVDHEELPIRNVAILNRFNDMWRIKDPQRAREVAEIIRHNVQLHDSETLAVLNIYLITAYKQEFKALREEVQKLLHSSAVKRFKEVSLANEEWVHDILSMDVGTTINFKQMTNKKFAKHEYHGAYVMGYNIYEKEEALRNSPINNVENTNEVQGGWVEWKG